MFTTSKTKKTFNSSEKIQKNHLYRCEQSIFQKYTNLLPNKLLTRHKRIYAPTHFRFTYFNLSSERRSQWNLLLKICPWSHPYGVYVSKPFNDWMYLMMADAVDEILIQHEWCFVFVIRSFEQHSEYTSITSASFCAKQIYTVD